MLHCFQFQIYITTLDVGFNIILDCWPIILPGPQFMYFVNFRVACQSVIIVPVNEFGTNSLKHKK